MSTLTFIVLETPNPALAAVGDELTLEQAAQLTESNAKEMFTHALRQNCATLVFDSASSTILR